MLLRSTLSALTTLPTRTLPPKVDKCTSRERAQMTAAHFACQARAGSAQAAAETAAVVSKQHHRQQQTARDPATGIGNPSLSPQVADVARRRATALRRVPRPPLPIRAARGCWSIRGSVRPKRQRVALCLTVPYRFSGPGWGFADMCMKPEVLVLELQKQRR